MTVTESLTLAGALVISLGGGGILVLALSSWLGKVWANRLLAQDRERYRQESQKVLEVLREKSQKGIFVHKVQFETEFSAYREIWKALSSLVAVTVKLRPIVDQVQADKTKDEIKKDRLKEFADAFNQVVYVVREYKPFVASSLDVPLERLLKLSRDESIDYEYDTEKASGPREYWKKREENINLVISEADNICSKIRERIGLLVVIEDQSD